jgi:hypothetical protein
MTDITPPPELVSKWCYEDGEEIKSSPRWFFSVCAKAAQWGADQELEACCEWIAAYPWLDHPELLIKQLRAAHRPKPPSLKEQALQALAHLENGAHCSMDTTESAHYIRRALEQLP